MISLASRTEMIEKILFKVARQWIAGQTVDEALLTAKQAYKDGRHAIINKLGEYHTSKNVIAKTVDEYQLIIDSFRKWKIRGAISVKPTQVGLSISQKECFRNLEKIISSAQKAHVFVWFDMESSDHTDEIIELYNKFFVKYERLGIALQANLKRTKNDLVDLIRKGAKIRLVKGAYREKSQIAYKSRKEVDTNFVNLMMILFKESNEFGIATHDSKIIEKAIALSNSHHKRFEFQMLKGIRDEIKGDLVKKKIIVSDYIPYGTNWIPYSFRRILERKRNILLLGSSFIHSHRV